MKKYKRKITLFLAVSMSLAMVGCGTTEPSEPSDSTPESPVTQAVTTADITTETTAVETTAEITTAETVTATETEIALETTEPASEPDIIGGADSTQAVVVDEFTYIGYSDKIEFIINSMQTNWTGRAEPHDLGLSDMYKLYGDTSDFGYVKIDIDGNGIDELLFGENNPNGYTVFYDIFTVINGGSVVSLASGGERQRYYINTDNQIVCEASSGADDSSVTVYQLRDGMLMIANDNAVSTPEMYKLFTLDSFSNYVNN